MAVTGLTSNPTILGHAMAASSDYDDSLRNHLKTGVSDTQELVYSVALEDITEAADLFRPIWTKTGGFDGYISIEVPPGLAYETDRSIEVARKLHKQANRPNLLIKIPGTPPGLAAMERLVSEGVGINVTLLFSDAHYLRTADAYIEGIGTPTRLGEVPRCALGSLRVRQPLGQGGLRPAPQAPAWLPRPGGDRKGVRISQVAPRQRAVAEPGRGGRQTSTGAVGVHLDQRSGLPRHLLPG